LQSLSFYNEFAETIRYLFIPTIIFSMLIYHVKLRDVKGNEKNIFTQKIKN